MISVYILKQNNNIVAIEVSGHSGYAEEGSDIVCSAVSTLVQNLGQSLVSLTNANPKIVLEEDTPLYSVTLTEQDSKNKEANLLINSTYLGLKDIAKQYKKYISIKEKNKWL